MKEMKNLILSIEEIKNRKFEEKKFYSNDIEKFIDLKLFISKRIFDLENLYKKYDYIYIYDLIIQNERYYNSIDKKIDYLREKLNMIYD